MKTIKRTEKTMVEEFDTDGKLRTRTTTEITEEESDPEVKPITANTIPLTAATEGVCITTYPPKYYEVTNLCDDATAIDTRSAHTTAQF